MAQRGNTIKDWPGVVEVLNPWKKFVQTGEAAQKKVEVKETINIIMSIRDLLQSNDIQEQQVLDKLMDFVKSICVEIINPQIKELKGDLLFKSISEYWERFSFASLVFNLYFTHMNNLYLKNERQITIFKKKQPSKEVVQLCLDVFRQQVFVDMKEHVHGQILHFINLDRHGDTIDFNTVKSCVELFAKMNTPETDYYKQLENSIRDDCHKFYAQVASNSAKQDSVPEFLRKCEKAYTEEKARVGNYLQHQTEDVLLHCLDETLLPGYVDFMLGNDTTGLNSLIKSNAIEDLKRMYELLGRLDLSKGVIPMSIRFHAHIYSVGSSAMLDQKNLTEANLQKAGQRKPKKKEEPEPGADGAAAAPPADGAEEGGKKKKKKKKKGEADGDEGTAAAAAEGAGGEEEGVKKKKKKKKESGEGDDDTDEHSLIDMFIESILAEYRKFNNQLTVCFLKDSHFHDQMTKAFQRFLNENPSDVVPFARLLGIYADNYIKRMQGQNIDEPVMARLEEIVNVLDYLTNKDDFVNTYKTLLAKRLLDLGKSAEYDDLEKQFIRLLKKQGNNFTLHLEGMFNDFEKSREEQGTGKFMQWIGRNRITLPFEFDSYQLTISVWPPMEHPSIIVPNELDTCVKHYVAYYKKDHAQQELAWDHTHGLVQLSVQFEKKPCELTTGPINAIALLKFNNRNHDKTPNSLLQGGGISIDTLVGSLGLDRLGTKIVVMSLSQRKAPILFIEEEEEAQTGRKGGIPDDISEDTWNTLSVNERKAAMLSNNAIVKFNTAFTPARHRMHIPPYVPMSAGTIQVIDDQTQQERKHLLEAAIVRIMKSENRCELQKLIGLIYDSIKTFRPERRDIMQRIEDLILREYIRRDDVRKQDLFHYIA